MNTQKFTQKSLAALQAAQDLASEYGNQQLSQPHLLSALLADEGGLVPQLLERMGLTLPSFEAAANKLVADLPKISGPGREAGKVYITQDLDAALNAAEAQAKAMGDEYVSVEHLLL